jgi:hypothetical protein
MTEHEWLNATQPWRMLEFLLGPGRASDRKLRLFAAACCRRSWEQLTNRELRLSIETAELFADGKVSQKARGSVFAAAKASGVTFKTSPPCVAFAASLCSVKDIRLWIGTIWYQSLGGPIQQHSSTAVLLRDIFGNPFRPLPPRKGQRSWQKKLGAWLAWKDGTVAKPAQGIYEARAFDHLPVLADALEEAGCTDAALLGHLRGPGPHVRGCHGVDLLLGRG